MSCHDLRPLTRARAVSVELPEARPAGGWQLMCSQLWSSPPGLQGKPVSALENTNDVLLDVNEEEKLSNGALIW